MRHGASLSPLTSLNWHTSRHHGGVGSPSFSRHSFTQSARLRRATRHSPLPLCFHSLADSLSLFALFFRLRSFIFNSLQTLLPKHPGCGGSSLAFKRADVPFPSACIYGTARPTFRPSDRSLRPGAGDVIAHGHEQHDREPEDGSNDHQLGPLRTVF